MNTIKLHTLSIVACCLIVISSSVSAQDVRNDALRYTQITAGSNHTCAILVNGTGRCWGAGRNGQLGNGVGSNSAIPVAVKNISTAITISAGNIHTCVVLVNGTAGCWGGEVGGNGILGDANIPNSLTPILVTGLSNAIVISANASHSCAVLADGTARCWGAGGNGRLGNNATANASTPVTVTGLSNAITISAGFEHTCAVLADGTARCWGKGSSGRLGINGTPDSPIPVTVTNLSTAITISAGGSHSCALLVNGTAQCWGGGSSGRLGNGATDNSLVPVTVTGLSNAIAISVGDFHTCVVLADGTARCWGLGNNGRLGNNAISGTFATPVAVQGLSNAIGISGGGVHNCAILVNGSAQCWGSGDEGQLGNGGTSDSLTPVAVQQGILFNPGSGSFTQISAGQAHTCAILVSGNAQCWGWGSLGRLGNGAITGNFTAPAGVNDLSNATAISAGDSHSCALLANGTARCWGNGANGRLGNGATAVSAIPVAVSNLSTAIDISAGQAHTCAVLANGTARCWGNGANGRLGNNTEAGVSLTPVAVSNLSTAIDISAGDEHTCAVLADGKARCWGNRANGRIGNAGVTGGIAAIPKAVSSLSTAIAISAGAAHTCALLANGNAWCWGAGANGRLGNGQASTDSVIPSVVVSNISTFVDVNAGGTQTCATLADGTARCWGEGGRLGNGETTLSNTPVTVKDIKSATSISSGVGGHSCAVLAGGTAECWGVNGNGQLGDGKTADSTTPVNILEELRLWIKVFLEGPLQ